MNTEQIFALLLLADARAYLAARIRITDCGCWEWTRGGDGRYGHVYYGGYRFKAHVFAHYCYKTTKLYKTFVLLHSCDNPPCCNPEHTNPGLHKTNMRDMWAKGSGRSPFIKDPT